MPRHVEIVVARGVADLARLQVPIGHRPELWVVDVIARLLLASRRSRCRIRLIRPGVDLLELLDLVGLRIEVVGQAEVGEQLGVEEVVVPDDPVA